MEEKDLNKKNLVEKVDEIYKVLENPKLAKVISKELKLPRKARVNKRKMKGGYIGVLFVNENGICKGEKCLIEDSTFRTKDGNYHQFDVETLLFWEGKFPFVILPSTKLSPFNFRTIQQQVNEIYGQKLIMAKMWKDFIKAKAKGAGILIWILIGAVVIGVIYYLIKSGGIGKAVSK